MRRFMCRPRYMIVEVSGYPIVAGRVGVSKSGPGVSVSVVDTAHNCRVVARYDSESYPFNVGQEGRIRRAREAAQARALELEEGAGYV